MKKLDFTDYKTPVVYSNGTASPAPSSVQDGGDCGFEGAWNVVCAALDKARPDWLDAGESAAKAAAATIAQMAGVQDGQGGLTDAELDDLESVLSAVESNDIINARGIRELYPVAEARKAFDKARAILARQTAPTVGSVPGAGAVALVPKWAGEFATIEEWVDRAQEVLSANGRGPAICVDAKGRRCAIGRDFSRARDENAFPVRYFWECELAQASRAAVLEGWRLVPVIPTERMLAAAACTSGDDWTPGTTGGNSEGNSYRRHIAQKEYAAMLAAAPAAQEGTLTPHSADIEQMLDADEQEGKALDGVQGEKLLRYTCIGKGGTYERVGYSNGAGTKRGDTIVIYRSVNEPDIYYHRSSDDFEARMQLIVHSDDQQQSPATKPCTMRMSQGDEVVTVTGASGQQGSTRTVEPDECAANMNGHSYGQHGPNGERQCKWCGEEDSAQVDTPLWDEGGEPANEAAITVERAETLARKLYAEALATDSTIKPVMFGNLTEAERAEWLRKAKFVYPSTQVDAKGGRS